MATLVAFTATMGPIAADEAIEVFDLLMGDLVRFSGTKANKDRLRTIKELNTAAIVLRHAWMTISRTLSDLDVDLREMVVGEIAREPDEDEALTLDQLYWAEQNYIRAGTLTAANSTLVDYHSRHSSVCGRAGGAVVHSRPSNPQPATP